MQRSNPQHADSPPSRRARRTSRLDRLDFLAAVHFDRSRGEARARSLFASIRAAIRSGELLPGTRLPSTRSIASNAGIARNTVVDIFERLVADGLVHARVGSGTYVCAQAPSGARAQTSAQPMHVSRAGRSFVQPSASHVNAPPGIGALRPGQPALDRFPADALARHLARAVRLRADVLCDGGGGNRELRRQIADRLRVTRNVHCSADQIVIVSDRLHAAMLLTHVLVDRGDTVCVEDPSRPETARIFAMAGAELAHVGLGIDGSDLAAQAAHASPRVIYVTPSHQSVTGAMMTADRRRALLRWGSDVNALIVEDDGESDVCRRELPVAAIHSLDPDGRVAYIGNFHASMTPAVSIAYLVAPLSLVPALIAAQRLLRLHASPVEQAALAAFIAEGLFARHLADTNAVYIERHAALLHELDVQLRDVLRPGPAACGLTVLATLPPGVDDVGICRHAATRGLYPEPLSAHFAGTTAKQGLLLGFGSSTPAQLRKDVAALQDCVRLASRAARVAS